MEELDIQFVDQLPAAPASQLDIAFIDQPAARAASGVVDAFEAGLEGSSAGLAYRGKLPDIGLDPANATFFQKIAAQAGGVVGDLPAMFAGAVAGGVAGGAAGSAVPVVGNAFGAVMGAGAGAMGVPTAIRESLVQSYQNGEIKGVADFLNRTSIVLKETGKDALIGALTGYAGKRALMGAEAMGLGAPGTVAAVLAAETGALTTAPAALEGRLPEWDDFANAAVMVVGLRAATTAGGAAVKTVSRGISNIYARTGVTPAEVALHSNLDPQIKADLGVPDMATPEIVAWKDRSAKSLAVDGVTTSNDLAARIRDDLGPDHFVTRVLEKLEPRLKGYKVEVLPDSEWKFRGYSETRQAQADPKKMVLQFRDSVKLEPAVHEIIHEATQAELIVNPAFTQDITAIMGRVRGEIEAGTVAGASKADMKSVKKALKNPAEFVAYGLSSPGTINVLRGVRGAGQSPTMFTTFVRTVAQAFGFKPQEYSAIHDLIHAVDVGVETSPDYRGGTIRQFIRQEKAKLAQAEAPPAATEVVGAVETAPAAPEGAAAPTVSNNVMSDPKFNADIEHLSTPFVYEGKEFFIDAGPLEPKDAELKGATHYVNLHPTAPETGARGEFYGEIKDGVFHFLNIRLDKSLRGKGTATDLYRAAIDWAQARGLGFSSDREVTFEAERIYKRLQDQGYKFERNPNLKPKEGGYIAPLGEAAFTLVAEAGKSPSENVTLTKEQIAHIDDQFAQANRVIEDLGKDLAEANAALEGKVDPEPYEKKLVEAAGKIQAVTKELEKAQGATEQFRAERAELLEKLAERDRQIEELKAGKEPQEREIPRAYEQMAQDENTREAIQFSEKAQQAAAHPFIEVKKIPGEPTKPYELNYNRINTTDDVNSILAVTSKVYENEIIAQRRGGTVSWEQTEAEAGDYLRQLLGADTVPVRQPGTPAGAAELLARRDMVVGAAEDNRRRAEEFASLENPTIEQTAEFLASFDRLASIQAQFLGARAEAGRALNILRNTRSIGDRAEQIGQLIKEFGDDPQKLALMVLALESPEQAAKFAREKAQATTWQKVVEAYRAGLISGPFSQIQNIAGNLFMIPVRPLVDAAAAGIGRVTPGEQTVYAREALARVLGNLHGVADGARQAKVALLTGDAQANALENKRNAIEGRLGETIRLPFRGLAAGDALIRTMVERGEAYALAARQAIKEGYDPATREFRDRYIQIATNGLTAEMQLAITEAGNRGSFNMPLGSMGRAAQNMIRAWKLEWAVPFVQTPANVAKEVLRLTPAAPLVDTWRADFAKGGAARDKAVAELMVGSGIGAVAFSAAAAGYITGGGDPDPQKRASKMASGWQPYSIKYNGQYYSFRRLAPIGTVIGLYADMFEVWDHMDEGERDQVPKIAAMAVSNAITSQTFLQGLTLLLNAVTAPDQKMGTFLQGLAGSVVPGLVSQTNQVLDPYQRQINSMLDAVKARIFGVSETLPPDRDLFGEPIVKARRAIGILPITVTTESDDKVRLEAARLGIGVAKTPNSIQMPAKGDRKLGKVELSPQQKDVFAETKGKLAHQMLTPYVNSPTWDLMPDMQQEMIYKKVFEIANEYASKKAVSQDQRQTKAQQIHDELIRRMAPKQPSILSEGLP